MPRPILAGFVLAGVMFAAGGCVGARSSSRGDGVESTPVTQWSTTARQTGSCLSPALRVEGKKLGISWDASSPPHEPPFPPNAPHANGYGITVWGSVDGRTRNRVIELLRCAPQELNDREGAGNAFFFYQGSVQGLAVPFPYAIVEFTNLTGEELASNLFRVWTSDADRVEVRVPLLGFWGELAANGTPGDTGTVVEQQRDYQRIIDVIDVTVYADQPASVEYYEQSWNEMRLVFTAEMEKGKQTVLRIHRGGFPRFVLLVRNRSATRSYCEMMAVGKTK